MHDTAGARQNVGQRDVIKREDGIGQIGRNGIPANEENGASAELAGGSGSGLIEIFGEMHDGGAKGEDDGRLTGGEEGV